MIITCNHCHKEQEARVTRTPPHRVVCAYCSERVEGVNDFTVRSLVAQKRFVAEEKGQFSFFCETCKGIKRGHLQKDEKAPWVKCTGCGEKMSNVSDFTMRLMSGITFTDETP